MVKKIPFILFLMWAYAVSGQKTFDLIVDSLQGESYETLFDRIRGSDKDPRVQTIYLRAYLDMAKDEYNWERMVQGYKNYLHRSKGDMRLVYADSMILVANRANDASLIGSAYLTKGIVHYNQKKYREAVELYLMADRYIIRTGDDYLKHKLKFNMALVKYYTEHYDEAILLLNVCRVYFKEKSPAGYLNTLHLLGRCHSRMRNYGLSSEINKLGITEGKRLGNTDKEVYFVQTEGINHVMRANYVPAIRELDSTLRIIHQNKNDFANEVLGKFYLGKSYWGLGEHEKAIAYFKKVDTSFIQRGYMKVELLDSYKFLSEYYATLKNQDLQFLYLKRHVDAINFMRSQDKYLDDKIKDGFDLKRVQREKEQIERLLWIKSKWRDIWIVVGVFLFALLLWFVYKYYRTRKAYRERFDAIMKENGPPLEKTKERRMPGQRPDIPPENIDKILKQLDSFERGKYYLDKKMSANKLAVTMDVNSKYLSQIIAYYRKKRVTEYINDLRVDHIVDLLKEDRKLAYYNNRSLAEVAGFNSERTFINAFKSRKDITPKFFVEELKKKREEKQ